MNNKRRNFLLMHIINSMQGDNPNSTESINKSVVEICRKRMFSWTRCSIIFLLSLSPIKQFLVSVSFRNNKAFAKFLEYSSYLWLFECLFLGRFIAFLE